VQTRRRPVPPRIRSYHFRQAAPQELFGFIVSRGALRGGAMKTVLTAMLFVFGLPIFQVANEDKATIILPNPRLLTCRAADCSQLWSEKSAHANAVFPKQLIIDSDHGCPYGVTALYEKSVSIDDLAASITEKYGKWTVPAFEKGPLRLWRVEP